MPADGFDDIEEFFLGIESDFICEVKAIGNDVKLAVVVAGDIAVGKIGPQRVHPILNSGRHGNPDPIARIAQDKIHFPDRGTVDAVGQNSRGAIARHDLQTVGSEIGDQNITFLSERQPVGQRSLQIAAGFAPGLLETSRSPLRDDLLAAIGSDSHYSPRASADQSVPSFSARMHSGRCRSWPMYWSFDLSIPKSAMGFTSSECTA